MSGFGEVKEVKEAKEVKDRKLRYGPVKNYTDLYGLQAGVPVGNFDLAVYKKIPARGAVRVGSATPSIRAVHPREYRGGVGQTQFSGGVQTASAHCGRRDCRNQVLD